VVPGTSCPQGSQWTTLSYTWGEHPAFVKLTAENLIRLADGFPSTLLPPTFRDAAELCRSIGVHYIWIDSLCILQSGKGSTEDWLQHATEMRKVYWNAHLNISADWGDSPESGLFTLRNTGSLRTPLFHFRKGPLVGPVAIGCYQDEMEGYSDSPLSKRGWVLQERILSPRSIHFCRDQIRWQCSNPPFYKSERFPDGFDFGFVYPTFRKLSTAPSTLELQSETGTLDYLYVANTYSELCLTYMDTDRYPAFGAIAEYYCRRFNEDYIAGFLKCHLPLALGWQVGNSPSASSSDTVSSNRPPSWSWIKSNVGTGISEAFLRSARSNIGQAETAVLLSHYVELVDPDNKYGQLKYAELRMRGRLATCVWDTTLDERGYISLKLPEVPFPVYASRVRFDSFANLFHTEREQVKVLVLCTKEHEDRTQIHFIVLEKSNCDATKTFIRIGAGVLEFEDAHDVVDCVRRLPLHDVVLI